MTDITDQDRRDARKWADGFMSEPGVRGSRATAAARVILATVDAPAPTIAERLREQFYYPEQTDEKHGIILDAAQMERDLAEARAEAKTWREQDENDCEAYMEELASVREALAVEGRRVEKIAKERDEARAEVERRTTEQKGAESNAESLDPAPRVITNPDELDRSKRCTVILDSVGVICERASLGDGWFTTQHGTDQTPYIELPVTVLWEPEA